MFTGSQPEFRIGTAPRPSAVAGEALLRVRACGICGSDLHVTAVPGIVQPGAIMGHELAGEIVEVGPEPIGDWAVGQRVFALPLSSCGRCDPCRGGRAYACVNANLGLGGTRPGQKPGAFAEYVCVGTNDLVQLPDHIGYDVGCLLEPLSVAMAALRMASMPLGARVLILGGGPIGLAIAALARVFGARRIAVSEPTLHRRVLATELGATDTIDPGNELDVGGAFISATGAAPDVVFEAVGRPGMLNAAVAAVGVQGMVVAAGISREPDMFDHVAASAKEARIGLPLFYTIEDTRLLLELIEQERLRPGPLISHRIGLENFPEAFAALRSPTDQVKVVVQP
jgi:(R,R)-butanediol dehydrogenase/meso-butanediol dehydrogenase/diacetyl reductase